MTLLEIILIALGVAMDCLAVSIAAGICLNCVKWIPILKMAFLFAFFQALMPLLGWLGAHRFSEYIVDYDHWFAFLILSFLGAKMIYEGLQPRDINCSGKPKSLKVIVVMAIATSIDALAVGICFAFQGMTTFQSILFPITIIGFITLFIALFGFLFGVFCGKRYNVPAEVFGGVVLIFIGCKILIEHLFFC